MNESPWNDVRVAEVKRLWESGESASKIGAGLGVSRNAIIGKVHRLKLPPRLERPRPIRVKKPAPPKPVETREVVRFIPKGKYDNTCHMWVADGTQEIAVDIELSPDDIPVSQRKTFFELKERHCRFPYGDVGQPNFFFCGADKEVQSYCGFHARVAFRGIASLARTSPPSEIEARHRSRLAGRRLRAVEVAVAKQEVVSI